MNTAHAHELQGETLVIRPNRSLPISGMVALFAAFTMWATAVGIAFTLLGAWMTVPFAGLEVLAVGLLCGWFYRHRDDCELITIDASRVHIMKRQGGEVVHHDFARAWVRVRLESPPGNIGPGRLLVGSHGRLVSLADEISEGDRAMIAQTLRRMLKVEA